MSLTHDSMSPYSATQETLITAIEQSVGVRPDLLSVEALGNRFPTLQQSLWRECLVAGMGVAPDGTGRCVFALKLPELGNLVACGRVPTGDEHLLRRLLRSVLRNIDLERRTADFDACLNQLTYDLEEQAWLRHLLAQMRLCDARHSIRQVAGGLLQSLQTLIRAEAVALLDAPRKSGTEERLSSWFGQEFGSDLLWEDWLWREQHTGKSLTHVANGQSVDPLLARYGVRSLVAVPLLIHGQVHGWMLAINRASGGGSEYSALPVMLEERFGSVETSLMEAAASAVSTHAHNVDLLREREELVLGVIRATTSAIDARDPYTRGHSERVARYARLITEKLRLSAQDTDRYFLAGLLHDVGKIGIPDRVLTKPEQLTPEEFDLIKQHPEIGHRILINVPQFKDLLPGVLHHHERIDGRGYPHGLAGEEIPLIARVLAVADSYDAMTSDRPYRRGMSDERAREILRTNTQTQWDGEIVQAFMSITPEELAIASGSESWESIIAGTDSTQELVIESALLSPVRLR